MATPPRDGLTGRLRAAAVDLGPLRRHRHFRRLWVGQLISGVGRQITVVALPFQIYSLTGSTLAVGLLGVAQVVPLMSTSLLGGAISDRVDRRRLLLVTNLLLAGCSLTLALVTRAGSPPVLLLFVMAALIAGFGAVDQPARTALYPNLVSRADLPAAVALGYGLLTVTAVGGPALGGVVIGRLGLAAAYGLDALTFLAALGALLLIPAQPPQRTDHERPLRSIRTGLRYLRSRRAILGSFAIDLNAMVFGMPRALFPALAATRFHTGPAGLGLLYAAPAVGSMLAVLGGAGLARSRRLGRAVVVCVLIWGGAIAVAGLTTRLGAALVLLAVAGAADSLSAICRSTMMQTTTPDHLRGRLSSAYAMVVMGGPYIGDVESGAVGAIFTPAISMVSGGVVCIAGVGVVTAAFPELWSDQAGGIVEAASAAPMARGADEAR
jgi:predicted MFS family arabinose efflux permease